MYLAILMHNPIVLTTAAEADIFGLDAAREPDGFVTTALKSSEDPKPGPGRREIIFFDHPSGHQRILMAMRWKAEHLPETRRPDPPVEKK